jgi:PHD/YefM family antitoxin component YafN of YafNO toxin-antitoxin module
MVSDPMPATTLSSRAFNQDTGAAKRAARHGPVFITDRGRLSHVLLSIEDYQKLAGAQANIIDLLAMPAAPRIEFAAPRLDAKLARAADLC